MRLLSCLATEEGARVQRLEAMRKWEEGGSVVSACECLRSFLRFSGSSEASLLLEK